MTTQPDRVHHLLDRLLRGVLLPAEAEQLAGLVRELERQVEDQVANRAAQAITAMGTDVREARTERDRYRLAWQSARQRAEAYGEGIMRLCDDRDTWKGWLEQEQAHSAGLRTEVARLTAGTTPAEHCGRQKPSLTQHTERTECVLRPGHHGSHADQHGARWWWISNAGTTP
ncbi:hypothetical protein [Streptomyces bacillaris]|uniref:hypothetical protein n=1 Tax=Streptomyces bacillaris TaxID=68179 RepID=UPI003D7266A1